MRDPYSWRARLTKQLRDQWQPSVGRVRDLLDAELGLFLLEQTAPDEPADSVWALLAGYPIAEAAGVTLSDADRQRIAVARHLLWAIKSPYDWHAVLTAYGRVDEHVRGYTINQESGAFQQCQPRIAANRWEVYERALQRVPRYHTAPIQIAGSGVHVVGSARSLEFLTIPDGLPQPEAHPSHDLTPRADRVAIKVTWKQLLTTAEEMEQQEVAAGRRSSRWRQRLEGVRLRLRRDGQKLEPADELTIDGMLHLVGMVGAGKSTLVDVLTVWAARQGLRVTLVLGDVTATLRKVVELQALSVRAAPVLGQSNRRLHLERLHRLHPSADNRLVPPEDPAFDLVSTACALEALRDDPPAAWDVERAPCESLIPKDEFRQDERVRPSQEKACPLWHACQRHEPARRLVDADVWVATPASLIHTGVPRPLNRERVRYLEAAWARSDLLVIDEVDQVQAQVDTTFNPGQALIGGDDPWLDDIAVGTLRAHQRANRARLSDRLVRYWTSTVNNAHAAADLIYALLQIDRTSKPSALTGWLDPAYFTAWGLTQQLALAWAGYNGKRSLPHHAGNWQNDPLYRRLRALFDNVVDTPLGDGAPADELTGGLIRLTDTIIRERDEDIRRGDVRRWLVDLLDQPDKLGNDIKDRTLHLDRDDLDREAARLELTLAVAVLHEQLPHLLNTWPQVEEDLGLRQVSPSMRRPPRDYDPVVPLAPMGNVLGFQYLEDDQDTRDSTRPMGELRFFRYAGVGRWLILNLHRLFSADGTPGPNVLLLSGTSWASTSPRYHVHAPVGGILLPREEELAAIRETRLEFLPVYSDDKPVRVSGRFGDDRYAALSAMLRGLAVPPSLGPHARSTLEKHRDALKPGRQRLMLVVGSYKEARFVTEELARLRPSWKGQVRNLVPDGEDFATSWDGPEHLRRGDVSTLAETGAWILVTPLLAIERGHNILNDQGDAAIGAAYFLIRPHPRPNDLSYVTQRINQWAAQQIATDLAAVPSPTEPTIDRYGQALRGAAQRRWRGLLHLRLAYTSLDPSEREAVIWTQMVGIWQVIGRMVRGGVPAQAYFCDAAFAPRAATRDDEARDHAGGSLLVGMRDALARYLAPDATSPDRELVEALYGPLYQALQHMRGL